MKIGLTLQTSLQYLRETGFWHNQIGSELLLGNTGISCRGTQRPGEWNKWSKLKDLNKYTVRPAYCGGRHTLHVFNRLCSLASPPAWTNLLEEDHTHTSLTLCVPQQDFTVNYHLCFSDNRELFQKIPAYTVRSFAEQWPTRTSPNPAFISSFHI